MTTHTDHDTAGHPDLEEPRPGQELRDARERAGISRDSMAERLRLAPAQLDALERDDYAELPPPAFVRGYFRAYARELGLEPDDYIAAYNRSGVSSRDPEIRRGGVTDAPSGGRGGMIGLLLIALVAAGGIGAWWYQQRMVDDRGGGDETDSVEEEAAGDNGSDTEAETSRDSAEGDTDTGGNGSAENDGGGGTASGEGDRDADDASAAVADSDPDTDPDTDSDTDSDADADTDTDTASVDVDAAEATVTGADGEGDATEQPTVVVPERETPETDGDDATGGDTEVAEAGDVDSDSGTEEDAAAAEEDGEEEEPGATSPAATDAPTRVATEAAGSGPDEITLEFSSRSWLEVYDDRDRELAYTLYFGSEPVTLQGWAPFEIFLGNSPAVDVRFNGEEIDKSAFTRSNNTARFVVDASGVRAP